MTKDCYLHCQRDYCILHSYSKKLGAQRTGAVMKESNVSIAQLENVAEINYRQMYLMERGMAMSALGNLSIAPSHNLS